MFQTNIVWCNSKFTYLSNSNSENIVLEKVWCNSKFTYLSNNGIKGSPLAQFGVIQNLHISQTVKPYN